MTMPSVPTPDSRGDTELDRLYALLPALYRLRDAEQGGPLRALLAVIQTEFDRADADTARMYDNWFIETCEEWVVPYLGDLLGVRGLPPEPAAEDGGRSFSRRAYVANTLAYRRRKGTAAVLEQLARDVTGWDARAVEFWQLLAVTQQMNHVRPQSLGTVSLRGANALELVDTPFEQGAARTLDVRHIDNRRGKYNLPNVGLFLWRLQSYPVTRATPRPAAGLPDGFYTFHPAGLSAPLFNRPRTEASISGLSGELNVPGRLRRRALFDELSAPPDEAAPGFLDADGPPAFEVLISETPAQLVPVAVSRDRIAICHLGDLPGGDWRRPPAGKDVAVDPVLGRLSLPAGVTPDRVQVSYAYGFAADVGGGPYDRTASVTRWLEPDTRPVTWQAGVTQDQTLLPSSTPEAPLFPTIQEALAAWNSYVAANPEACGLICLMDSGSYAETLTGSDRLEAPADARLAVTAADWPRLDAPGLPPSLLGRRVGELVPDGVRPHLRGDVEIGGAGEVILDGLLIEGRVIVPAGDVRQLRLHHCTLVPAAGGLTVESAGTPGQSNDRLVVSLYRTISGPVVAADTVRRIEIAHSILDHGGTGAMTGALALEAPEAELESVTLLGRSRLRELSASNTIFGAVVEVARRQRGCVRFSYVPPGSHTPRRYRCRPEGASEAERVMPRWSSLDWGEPGYGQLAPGVPCEIARGADDENEMGVFRSVQQAQRVAALRDALDEYLRFGLEAGVFFVE